MEPIRLRVHLAYLHTSAASRARDTYASVAAAFRESEVAVTLYLAGIVRMPVGSVSASAQFLSPPPKSYTIGVV